MGNSQGKPVDLDGEGESHRRPAAPARPDHFSLFSSASAVLTTSSRLSPPPVNLNHFRLLRVVGRGAFGKVRIVERKDTGLSFALKYIRKDEGMDPLPRRPF